MTVSRVNYYCRCCAWWQVHLGLKAILMENITPVHCLPMCHHSVPGRRPHTQTMQGSLKIRDVTNGQWKRSKNWLKFKIMSSSEVAFSTQCSFYGKKNTISSSVLTAYLFFPTVVTRTFSFSQVGCKKQQKSFIHSRTNAMIALSRLSSLVAYWKTCDGELSCKIIKHNKNILRTKFAWL